MTTMSDSGEKRRGYERDSVAALGRPSRPATVERSSQQLSNEDREQRRNGIFHECELRISALRAKNRFLGEFDFGR